MDDMQFDRLARFVASPATRRTALGALVGLGLGAAPAIGPAVKAKKKKKKKKPPAPPCPVRCGQVCCSQAQPACCDGPAVISPLCYDPATEECCPDLGGQIGKACPPGTRCEFWDDPDDTLGPYSSCCPDNSTTCGDGCCPAGMTCCLDDEGDPYGAFCCPDSSCDPADLACEPTFSIDGRTE